MCQYYLQYHRRQLKQSQYSSQCLQALHRRQIFQSSRKSELDHHDLVHLPSLLSPTCLFPASLVVLTSYYLTSSQGDPGTSFQIFHFTHPILFDENMLGVRQWHVTVLRFSWFAKFCFAPNFVLTAMLLLFRFTHVMVTVHIRLPSLFVTSFVGQDVSINPSNLQFTFTSPAGTLQLK